MLRIAAPVALVMAMACVPMASGAVLYTDNFESGSAAGWTATSGVAASVVSDNVTDSSGTQALDLNQAAAGTAYATVTLPSSVTLNDGDSLSLSFNVRLPSGPGTIGDRKFRFGFYNSTNTEGYAARMDIGADAISSSNHAADLWASVGALGSSTGSTPAGKSLGTSNNVLGQLVNTDVDNVIFTINRSGTSVVTSMTVTDLTNAGTFTFSGTDSTTTVPADTGYSFDEFLIGQNGGSAQDYRIDNVVVSNNATAAPEPASLGVLGVAGIGRLVRRRKM